ncbi:MAG: sugar porter family MFS transporter [Kiritimatiellales bacterium]|nr:sugar porter family MFS transporter [Kiritimatiellales bacterium]
MKNKSPIYASTVIAALGGLLFGFDTAVISGTTGALQSYFGLSEAMLGFTVVTALIGTIIGSMAVNRPSDIWGRKRVLIVLAVLYTVSALGSGLVWNLWSFWIFRFIGGLAVGGASVVSPMYIAEISPAEKRGRLVGWQQFNVCFGICLAYISNYFVAGLPCFSNSVSGLSAQWRWMFMMEAIPSAIFFLLLFRIPFSPRWLVEKKRHGEARAVLESLGMPNADVVYNEIVESMHQHYDVVHTKFWTKVYWLPITAAIALAVFNQLSGINALLYYAPKVFSMGGSDGKMALLQSIPIGIMLVIGTAIGLALIDKLGRKKLLIIGSLGMAVFLALVGFKFLGMQDGEQVSGSIMWLFIGYLFFFGPSTGTVIWVYISEIFPNRIRAKGQSLGSFSHWFMAAVVSQSFPIAAAAKSIGPGRSFLFFAVCMVVQAVFVWKVLPETKGVSLEALQKKLGME